MTQQTHSSETNETGRLPHCGLLRRAASMAYDSLLVVAVLMVAAAIVVIPSGDGIQPGTLWFQLYLVVAWWGYFAVCWRMGGQTVGMRAWRVKLVTEKGERIGWVNAGLRFVVAAMSALFAGLGYFWSLFDAQGRSWHDMATATRLVVIPKEKK